MVGGYTGQLVALDAMTPSQLQAEAAQAAQATTESQLARATLPDRTRLAGAVATGQEIQNQQQGLALHHQMQINALDQAALDRIKVAQAAPAADAASPLAAPSTSSLFDPQVVKAMQSIDPDDPQAAEKWDTAMTDMEDEVPQAHQFVGNYSKANLQSWRAQIGAQAYRDSRSQSPQSPLAQAAPGAAPAAGGAPPDGSAGLLGMTDSELAQRYVLDPEGTQKRIQMHGMIAYQRSGNPDYLKRFDPEMYGQLATAAKSLTGAQKEAQEAEYAGMGQSAQAVLTLAGQFQSKGIDPNTAPEVRAAYREAITEGVGKGWLTPQVGRAELAAPKIDFGQLAFFATRAQTVAEWMKTSGTEAANEARAQRANPKPSTRYIGVTDTGKPIYHDENALPGTPDTTGNIPVNAKPGANAALFETKRNAYLQVHPNDTAGAIDFANGRRALPPGEAAIAARAAADREQQSAALTMQPFDAQAAYQQHYLEFTSAGATLPPGPSGPPGTPPAAAAPAAPAGRTPHGFTPEQVKASFAYKGATEPVGSKGHPFVPVSKAVYDKLPKGAYYIGLDGQTRIKG